MNRRCQNRSRTRAIIVSLLLAANTLLLSGVALSACPDETGRIEIFALGKGGESDEDGIGGSGHSSRGDDEDGIGGSGLFGTVTGFGSVCLNGQRIQYAEEVPVLYGGTEASSDALEIGQVVKVVATVVDHEKWATSIDVVFAAVGSIEEVDGAGFTVMGVRVEPVEGAIVNGQSLEKGSRVAVSGLRRPNGKIAASRIDSADSKVPDGVMRDGIDDLFGPGVEEIDVEGYLQAAGDEGLSLGYVQISAEALSSLESNQRPEVGARVRIRARRSEAGSFAAARVELIREARLLRDFERLDRERSNKRRFDRPKGPGGPLQPGFGHPNAPTGLDRPSKSGFPRRPGMGTGENAPRAGGAPPMAGIAGSRAQGSGDATDRPSRSRSEMGKPERSNRPSRPERLVRPPHFERPRPSDFRHPLRPRPRPPPP